MKQIVIVLLMVMVAVSANAFDISYSKDIENELEKVVAENDALLKKIDAKLLKEDKNTILEKQEKYKKDKNRVMNKYPEAEEVLADKIVYVDNRKLKGIKGRKNVAGARYAASDFIRTIIPDVLGEGEDLKVLYVREDYGADQEKDDDGNILENVDIKTYSYSVRIGRTLYGQPVFDSFASVDIDADTNEVISFDLNNWKPVGAIDETALKTLKKDMLKKTIDKRLDAQQKEHANVRHVDVKNVIMGWVFDETGDALEPAFVHYGTVDEEETSGEILEKKYSFLEMMEGSTGNTGKPLDEKAQMLSDDETATTSAESENPDKSIIKEE
ncbi:MAG: hypothetical protein JW969_09065 [Spirochaetales bacterium]|nr:hypothetical protein [Spirochaetales bacterium]